MKDGVLREISRPIMELNEIPRSRVLYSRSLIENKVIPFAHDILGELSPNLEERYEIYYPNVAFLIDRVYITQSKDYNKETVWLNARVLDTPSGRLLNKAIERDLNIEFLLRAFANATKLEGFEIVHEDGFDFITIDAYVKYLNKDKSLRFSDESYTKLVIEPVDSI
jgi:hypothetical protein